LAKSKSDCRGEEEERAGAGGQATMGSTRARAEGRRTAETTWELGSSDDNDGAGRIQEEWQREIENWGRRTTWSHCRKQFEIFLLSFYILALYKHSFRIKIL
jgi:hypothetical protein